MALPTSLLFELRRETQAAHAELDRRVALLQAPVSRQRYLAFLRGSLAAVAPLEARLQGWSGAERISRACLIRADLEALSSPEDENEVSMPALDIPAVDSDAAYYGVRYVIEGSALGGAVLAKALAPVLGLDKRGLLYLRVHGEHLGERWREFTELLENWGESASEGMRARACGSARAVFDLYRVALGRAGALDDRHE